VGVFGNVYVTDQANSSVRRITSDGQVGAVAGIGTSGAVNGGRNVASVYSPTGYCTG